MDDAFVLIVVLIIFYALLIWVEKDKNTSKKKEGDLDE